MDLKLLQVFKAVYELGSYSKAADYMDVTQPAVTGAIKKLDLELGYKCFIREGRGIAPTSEAITLYNKISNHIDSIQSALVEKTELNIYATENILLALTEIPNIKLLEAPSSEEQVYSDLRSGKVDIAIDHFSMKESSFHYEHVLSEKLVCAHSEYTSVTKEEYFASTHALLGLTRHNQSIIELVSDIAPRNVKFVVSSASNLLTVASRSDVYCSTLTSMAPLALQLGLNIFELPFPTKPVDFDLIHHKRYINDKLFKAVIKKIKKKLTFLSENERFK